MKSNTNAGGIKSRPEYRLSSKPSSIKKAGKGAVYGKSVSSKKTEWRPWGQATRLDHPVNRNQYKRKSS